MRSSPRPPSALVRVGRAWPRPAGRVGFALAAFVLASCGTTEPGSGDTSTPGDSGAGDTSEHADDTASDCATAAPADYTAAVGIRMLGVAAGVFEMGSEAAEASDDERPVHAVALTRPFWVGQTELTQAQYAAVTGENPAYFGGCDDCPVENVSWYRAAAFANAASDAEGVGRCYSEEALPTGDPYACDGYRLPTEAEWEYVARAGEGYTYAGSDDPDVVAWTSNNATDGKTHPVAQLAPNAWGLFDASGNVDEWTGDWYAGSYYAASPSVDPSGPATGAARVYRSGPWSFEPEHARVSNRYAIEPEGRRPTVGFRLVRGVGCAVGDADG